MGVGRLTALGCIFLMYAVDSAPKPSASHILKGDLLCSACEVLADALEKGMAKQLEGRETDTVVIGHRLDQDNRPKRGLYKGSELAALELLDGFCENHITDYRLRKDPVTRRRFFSGDDKLPPPDVYNDEEKEYIKHADGKYLQHSCNVFIDEQNEEVMGMLKKELRASEMADQLCNKTTPVCTPKYLEKYLAKELKDRRRWKKGESSKKKMAKKMSQRLKEEEEEKKAHAARVAKAEKNEKVQEGSPTKAGDQVPWAEGNAEAGKAEEPAVAPHNPDKTADEL